MILPITTINDVIIAKQKYVLYEELKVAIEEKTKLYKVKILTSLIKGAALAKHYE